MWRWALLLMCSLLWGCAEGEGPLAAADADTPDSGYVLDDPSELPPEPEVEAKPIEDTTETDGPAPLELKDDVEATAEADEPTETDEKPDANLKARLACQKDKGKLAKTSSGLFVCVKETDQGQKSCKKPSDCKGECLARSRTCAPFTPMLGCNEIITSGGGRATVCID